MPVVEAKATPQDSVKSQAPRVDERLMKPGKYEITEQHTFEIKIYMVQRNGRWIVLDGPMKDVEEHTVVFRMWNYDEMIELKKMATSYDPQRRIHMIDNDILNRLKLQRLIVSWTLDRENPRLKLLHVQGILSDESWKIFTKLQTNIITYIFDEMNKVYEFGG